VFGPPVLLLGLEFDGKLGDWCMGGGEGALGGGRIFGWKVTRDPKGD